MLQGYKERAINWASKCIANSIALDKIVNEVSFIPIPPSKTVTHPDFDERMFQVCNGIKQYNQNINIMNILYSLHDRGALHEGNEERDPDILEENLAIRQNIIDPNDVIILVDDVITSGATFKACKNLLLKTHPNKEIIGLFLARTVPAPIDWF